MARPSELRLAQVSIGVLLPLSEVSRPNFDTLEEDPLYLVLDKLPPHRGCIESAPVERERSLFNLDRAGVALLTYHLQNPMLATLASRPR
jgi:hypothetical protein